MTFPLFIFVILGEHLEPKNAATFTDRDLLSSENSLRKAGMDRNTTVK